MEIGSYPKMNRLRIRGRATKARRKAIVLEKEEEKTKRDNRLQEIARIKERERLEDLMNRARLKWPIDTPKYFGLLLSSHMHKIIKQYLFPINLQGAQEEYLMDYYCKFDHEFILWYKPALYDSRWIRRAIESNNLELIKCLDFRCLGNKCPAKYLSNDDKFEVVDYVCSKLTCEHTC